MMKHAFCLLGATLCVASWADANNWEGRRVIALERPPIVSVELPDASRFEFGDELYSALIRAMEESGRFLPVDPEPEIAGLRSALRSFNFAERRDPPPIWSGSFVPSATVRFEVVAFTFVTGSRGDRFRYGFDEEFRTPFNDGSPGAKNEFPLMPDGVAEPSWFESEFPSIGKKYVNTRTGLDIGDGLNIDLGFVTLNLKIARYRSNLRLKVWVDAPYSPDVNGEKYVDVIGTGWFFDLSGQYAGQGGGMAFGRKDAMAIAAKKGIEAVERLLLGKAAEGHSANSGGGMFPPAPAVPGWLDGLPLTARLDAVLEDGTLLLGTGAGANIELGARYRAGNLVVEVTGNATDGGLAKRVAGDADAFIPGLIFLEDTGGDRVLAKLAPASRSEAHTVELPEIKIPPSEHQLAYQNEPGLWEWILNTVLLPYRIWRFYKYDRKWKSSPDNWKGPDGGVEWSAEMAEEKWAKRIGLLAPVAGGSPVPGNRVAILDTGVDYNHPVLFPSIIHAKNLDFVSGDDRPYDDAYHGTAVAGAILAVNPTATLIPIKVFNPWGVTTSAAIFAGFEAAVLAGASVIVCPWATTVRSEALRQSVEFAVFKGVSVVAGTGASDRDLDLRAAYPASFFSEGMAGILPVMGVPEKDRLRDRSGFGARTARIAAPGQEIRSLFPRAKDDSLSGSAVAAGLVAGALSRISAIGAEERIQTLLDQAEIVEDLKEYVAGGRRLKIIDHGRSGLVQ
ncbi:MAG: S8 family serine peptidase [Bdellovibrionota bacterium]